MHSLHLKAAALPTLKPLISWDPIISRILQSRKQGFTPWERGWASRFRDLGLELGNARLLGGIHTFSAATLKVCEGGNHFAILGLSCKPSVFRGRRVRLKLPSSSLATGLQQRLAYSVHGRHFVLVADGRLKTSDKIMGRGEGVGSAAGTLGTKIED